MGPWCFGYYDLNHIYTFLPSWFDVLDIRVFQSEFSIGVGVVYGDVGLSNLGIPYLSPDVKMGEKHGSCCAPK